ncbi:MAG: DNA polymerase I [Deltaproteobacteria bacterium]|nr:DNA polymerase I [Deltaproteobacteria bacterium]
MPKSETLYLIDGSSYIYRAFYAIRNLSNSQGMPTNAVYGFTRMLMKVIAEKKPDYVAVAFDAKGPTFRHEFYPEYKANRPTMPEELQPQIPYIKRMVEGFAIPSIEREGVEADDLLGTLARIGEEKGLEVVLVSGDKDLLQLVTPKVRVYDTMKEKVFREEEVKEKFGVEPARVIEVMALMGDSSDNVPGIPGVGPKTAVKLIQQYHDVEGVLAEAGSIRGKMGEKIRENAELARISRKLVTIDTALPVDLDLNAFRYTEPKLEDLMDLLRELEFTTLLQEFSGGGKRKQKEYRTILDRKDLDTFLARIRKEKEVSFDLETTALDPMRAKIVGVSFSVQEDEGVYVPVAHTVDAPQQLSLQEVLETLAPLLTDPSIRKIGQNIKYDLLVLANAGVELSGIYFDTMVASYLINPSRTTHNLNDLALTYLNHKMITYKEVTGTGKKAIGFAEVPVEQATDYAAEDAEITYTLYQRLEPMLSENNLETLFHEIEMPLIPVLARMERAGVKVDADFLASMSGEIRTDLDRLITKIYDLAGEEFNINSTQQLARILFEKQGIKPIKKTKTGYSTNMEVLQQLAGEHELPREILEYRSLAKLKSTYIDALPRLIHPETGRVHTSFNQTVTATGRLSSSDPNLQNIPIRTPLGKKIREAFVAEPGHMLVSADYSQVELRILAHLSGDPTLIDAFQKNEDIHTRTAAEIFDLPPERVTEEMRRDAKTVNFGIIYGMGRYGLSRQLEIPVYEAERYIESYFARYPGVKAYQDRLLEEARKTGYVTTLMNRRRPIPELAGSNKNRIAMGERTAINTPIQGSAADIIKVAMIRIDETLRREKMQARMILQIHDELILEVPENELDRAGTMLREGMEGVVNLKVPLRVDLGVGKNWRDAH